jgi:hypothetical protein
MIAILSLSMTRTSAGCLGCGVCCAVCSAVAGICEVSARLIVETPDELSLPVLLMFVSSTSTTLRSGSTLEDALAEERVETLLKVEGARKIREALAASCLIVSADLDLSALLIIALARALLSRDPARSSLGIEACGKNRGVVLPRR